MNVINRQIFLFLIVAVFFIRHSYSQENNQVFLRIHNKEISRTEFERLFNKNNSLASQTNLDEYLEMFINFQLKVLDAEENKLHLQPSFLGEFSFYRKQLARPYLTHPETEERFMKEAYERMLFDIHTSHILIKLDPEAVPADTLFAWEKAIRIRDQIIAGEPFESVARRASDDPSAKTNNGDIGFFTAFQMVYPFEKAAWKLQIGEISMPVRTRFGYHIIRVNEKRDSKGEVKLQHILLRTPPGSSVEFAAEQKEKITHLHERITNGENFGQLAAEFSEDISSASNNGEMNWFGTGRMIPEFEDAAFSLKEKGSISNPFLTQYGWHIIGLLNSKKHPSFDEIKEEIRESLYSARDERSRAIQRNFVEILKKEYQFKEAGRSLETFYSLPESWFQSEDAGINDPAKFNSPLFFIEEKSISQLDFAKYLKENLRSPRLSDHRTFILQHYNEFISKKLLEFEDRNLENKYPEFQYLVKEYYDGLLLFEIMEKKIWLQSASDTTGLQNFYSQNKKKYLSPERIDATMVAGKNEKLIYDAHKFVSKTVRRKYSLPGLVNNITKRFGENTFSIEKSISVKGENPFTDKIDWKKGLSPIMKINGNSYFMLVHAIIKPEPFELEEIRGLVISDYLQYLENSWIESLKKKYKVTVNKEILSSMKKTITN